MVCVKNGRRSDSVGPSARALGSRRPSVDCSVCPSVPAAAERGVGRGQRGRQQRDRPLQVLILVRQRPEDALVALHERGQLRLVAAQLGGELREVAHQPPQRDAAQRDQMAGLLDVSRQRVEAAEDVGQMLAAAVAERLAGARDQQLELVAGVAVELREHLVEADRRKRLRRAERRAGVQRRTALGRSRVELGDHVVEPRLRSQQDRRIGVDAVAYCGSISMRRSGAPCFTDTPEIWPTETPEIVTACPWPGSTPATLETRALSTNSCLPTNGSQLGQTIRWCATRYAPTTRPLAAQRKQQVIVRTWPRSSRSVRFTRSSRSGRWAAAGRARRAGSRRPDRSTADPLTSGTGCV